MKLVDISNVILKLNEEIETKTKFLNDLQEQCKTEKRQKQSEDLLLAAYIVEQIIKENQNLISFLETLEPITHEELVAYVSKIQIKDED